MAEVASAAAAGIGSLALFPGADPSTVLAAFAGASVFVMSSQELGVLKKLVFLLLAFVCGMIAAPLSTEVLATVLPERIQVSESLGALLSSALVIKLLTQLIARADLSQWLPGSKQERK